MIFNQFEFLFLFLPLVVLLFNTPLLVPMRHVLLIGASLLFYGLSGWVHAGLLFSNVVWVWLVTRSSSAGGSRTRLTLAILPPFAGLFYFKYSTFVLNQFEGSLGTLSERFNLLDHVLLPAGISFFTFQLAAYAIDRFRGTLPVAQRFRDFAVYISFFPQLVAGPILRYSDVADALRGLLAFRLDRDAAARAAGYITIGLALKVLIADTLDGYISLLTGDLGTLGKAGAVFVTFAYSFQIYFDFYGYSLCAIGLGTLFGFRFPDNFLRPYQSRNIQEFWRRWHVTLSYWIRDYLYYPMGGNRTYVRNILIVFAVCGLWHGAGWNFIVWGLCHGLLVAAYHYGRRHWDVLPGYLQCTVTFFLVSVLWLLFLFDFSTLGEFTAGVWKNPWNLTQISTEMWIGLGAATGICFGFHPEKVAENESDTPGRSIARNVALGVCLSLVLVFLDRSQTFIYFRF